jgi:mxaJ protein
MPVLAQESESSAVALAIAKTNRSECPQRLQRCPARVSRSHRLRVGWIMIAVLALPLARPVAALSVCADPDYLPYSNHEGAGFENKVAVAVARPLGESVQYTWASYRGRGGFPQFLSATLDAKKCDVVMSISYGARDELTTQPYYVSSYVLVFPRSKNYSISNMDSPALKGLRIGFERETPAQEAIKLRGMISKAVGFDVADSADESPLVMLKAVANGKIDVLITWEPSIGAFLRIYPNLEVVPIPNTRALGAPEQFSFPMSIAVQAGDQALKQKLDRVIEKHGHELNTVLSHAGVRTFTPEEK